MNGCGEDGIGFRVVLPRNAALRVRAGIENGDLADIQHIQSRFAQLGLVERETQRRSQPAHRHEDFLRFLHGLAEIFDDIGLHDLRDLAAHCERCNSAQAARISPQRQTDNQHANHEEKRVVFRVGKGDFDRHEDECGYDHQRPLGNRHLQFEIGRGGSQVDRNRTHHADRVEAGEAVEIIGHQQDQNRQRDRDGERGYGNAGGVELGEGFRHVSFAGHHEKQTQLRRHGGIHRTEKQKGENHADD